MDISNLLNHNDEVDFYWAGQRLVARYFKSKCEEYFLCTQIRVRGPQGILLKPTFEIQRQKHIVSFERLRDNWEELTDEKEIDQCSKAILIQTAIK